MKSDDKKMNKTFAKKIIKDSEGFVLIGINYKNNNEMEITTGIYNLATEEMGPMLDNLFETSPEVIKYTNLGKLLLPTSNLGIIKH